MRKKDKKELLNDFLKEEKTKGRREQGLISLRSCVPKFFSFLDESGLSLTSIGTGGALDYQLWLLETGRNDGQPYSMRTINSYLVSITAFYQYLKASGLVMGNPFKEIRKVRSEKKLPSFILKENEVGVLLEEFEDFMSEGDLKRVIRKYRLHIICELLYSTGLRISEAAALKLEDIDLIRGTVSVVEGKGGYSRTAILNDYARVIFSIFINEIRPLILTRSHDKTLLFGTCCWGSFGRVVNRGLKEYSEKLNIPPIRSHGFRHALGYHLLRAGCSIRSIQEILGHKLLRNTEIYTKVDKEDLKEVLDRYHPRKKAVIL